VGGLSIEVEGGLMARRSLLNAELSIVCIEHQTELEKSLIVNFQCACKLFGVWLLVTRLCDEMVLRKMAKNYFKVINTAYA